MNNYIIYIHKNKINQKVYIGQTCQKPQKRWNNGEGYKSCSKFYNAIQKYGWENFEHIILYSNLSLEKANNIEQKLIKKYHSTEDQYGYNLTSGGKNFKHNEATKQKISLANKISQKGKHWNDKQRKIMSKMFSGEGNPFYGRHHTDETKQIISKKLKGMFTKEKHPFYGKHHTQQTKIKISNNRKNKGGRKVICLNTNEIFNTINEAARWCGLKNGSSIGQVCNKTGKQKTAGKHPITKEKLRWEFYNE